jgi:hypothetical protein
MTDMNESLQSGAHSVNIAQETGENHVRYDQTPACVDEMLKPDSQCGGGYGQSAVGAQLRRSRVTTVVILIVLVLLVKLAPSVAAQASLEARGNGIGLDWDHDPSDGKRPSSRLEGWDYEGEVVKSIEPAGIGVSRPPNQPATTSATRVIIILPVLSSNFSK